MEHFLSGTHLDVLIEGHSHADVVHHSTTFCDCEGGDAGVGSHEAAKRKAEQLAAVQRANIKPRELPMRHERVPRTTPLRFMPAWQQYALLAASTLAGICG